VSRRRVADLVDHDCVRSAVDNLSRYPHVATIASSISRVVGRYSHDDGTNQLQNCDHFLRGPYRRCYYKNSSLGGSSASEGRVCLMN